MTDRSGVETVLDTDGREVVVKHGKGWVFTTPKVKSHICNAWCGDGYHVGVVYSTKVQTVEEIAAAALLFGYEVLRCELAGEAPKLGEVMQPSGRPSTHAYLLTYRKCVTAEQKEEIE